MSDEETTDSPSEVKGFRTVNYDRLAYRSVTRARKLRQAKDWAQDDEAEFMLASANVLALLELADAIRGSKP